MPLHANGTARMNGVQSLATQREKLTKFHSAGVEHHFQSKNNLYCIYIASQNVYWEHR